MRHRSLTLLRAAGTLSLGSYALHQLRYLAGFGAGSSHALAHQGHAYLTGLLPALLGLLLASLGAVALVPRCGGGRARPGFRALWAACTATLLATYAAQELAEGWLAAGHPAGLAGLLGHGGLAALPIGAALGTLCALGLRGLRSLEPATSRGGGLRPARRPPRLPRLEPLVARRAGLDFGLGVAARPPPLSVAL